MKKVDILLARLNIKQCVKYENKNLRMFVVLFASEINSWNWLEYFLILENIFSYDFITVYLLTYSYKRYLDNY